jgi:hypothetical protein
LLAAFIIAAIIVSNPGSSKHPKTRYTPMERHQHTNPTLPLELLTERSTRGHHYESKSCAGLVFRTNDIWDCLAKEQNP